MDSVAEQAAVTAIESQTATTVNAQPQPTAIQSALEFWKSFDLNGRRAQLDKQGLDIADRQENSAASRKELSSITRNLRKSIGDASSQKEVRTTVRAFQAEVDALTDRAHAAETSFISLYKALYDAPDPADVLSESVQNAHALQQLREQLSNLKHERTDLVARSATTSSLEQRVRELESQLSKADQRGKDDARQMLEEKQSQWMAAQQKTIEAYELREQELIHQLRLENDSYRRSQAASDEMQQQLNEARSQLEHYKSSRASVNDLAAEDFERTRAEVTTLRRRCKQLENRLAGLPEDADVDSLDVASSIDPSSLSAEVASRDVQISQLKDQVAALEEVLGGKDQEKRNEFAKLSGLISEKDAMLAQMRDQLDQLPSIGEYETMKRQFETLQSFQLLDAESQADVESSGVDGEGQSIATSRTDTLEKRLLNKVKNLEGRMTKLRVDLSDRDSKIDDLLSNVRSYEDQIADQKALIAKLEDGINAITGDAGGVQSLKRRAVAASKGDADESGEAVDLITAGDEESQNAWDWGEKHQAEGLENIIQREPSMVDIIAGQRDRFRSRTLELEEDNRKLMEKIEKGMSDVDSLKNDNVKLYERLRFVQSYRQSNGSLGAPANLNATSTSIDLGSTGAEEEDGGGLLGKYRSLYEDMVNPFTMFNRRERHKRMSEMSAPERITLRAGQRALSTKTSRLVVFFYIISLHIFVALVLGFSNHMCDSDSVTTKATHST